MTFYRECPNCHTPKAWTFTISLFIFLTILGIIPGIIYYAKKMVELKCSNCGFVTQSIILHDKGMQDTKKPRLTKNQKPKQK